MSAGTHFEVVTTSGQMERGASGMSSYDGGGAMTGGHMSHWDVVSPLQTSAIAGAAGGGASGMAAMVGGGSVGARMGGFDAGAQLGGDAAAVGRPLVHMEDTEVQQEAGTGTITGFIQTTVQIPKGLIVNGQTDENLIFWTPDTSSGMHVSNISVSVRMTAHDRGEADVEPTKIKISMERDAQEKKDADREQHEIEETIQRLVKMAVETQPQRLREFMEARLSQGNGWDVVPSPNPVIESVTWQSVYNMMELHSVGIKISEDRGNTERAPVKHMRKELYIDGEKGIEDSFQIIGHPYGGASTRSDHGKSGGSLLVHERTTDNAFVANTVLTPTFENDLLKAHAGVTANVKFHTTHMLWAFQRMEHLFPIYISEVIARRKHGGDNMTIAENSLANSPDRVAATTRKLVDLSKDASIKYASDIITRTLIILSEYADRGMGGNWWHFVQPDGVYQYCIPTLFYSVIVREFAKTLTKHQAFNGGTALNLTAYALPSTEHPLTKEGNTSVYVNCVVRALYPKLFYCYLPHQVL